MNLKLPALYQVDDGFPSFDRDVLCFEYRKSRLHPQNPPLTKELNLVKVLLEQLTMELFCKLHIAITVRNSKLLRKDGWFGFRCAYGSGSRA
jgi:hypothetical protein